MIRHSGIIEELGLGAHGLRYIDCDPWAFAPPAPGTDGPGIVFHRDLDATCWSIERACGTKDADSYRRFVAVWSERSRHVMKAFSAPPTGSNLIGAFGGLATARGNSELSRQFLAPGDALLDEYFDSEALKAALAWFGAQSGPAMSEPGTAPMVGFAALMHVLPPGRAVGGSGALSAALASRMAVDGATVALGDGVTSIRRNSSHWTATTESGREVHARKVIAGCHILTTLDLLGRGASTEPRSITGGGKSGSAPASARYFDWRHPRFRRTAATPRHGKVPRDCNYSSPIAHTCALHTAQHWRGTSSSPCGSRNEFQRNRSHDRPGRSASGDTVVAVATVSPQRTSRLGIGRRGGGRPDRRRDGGFRTRVRRFRPRPVHSDSPGHRVGIGDDRRKCHARRDVTRSDDVVATASGTVRPSCSGSRRVVSDRSIDSSRWRCVRSQRSQCGSNRTVGQPPGRDSSLDASFEQVVKVTRRTSPADTPPPR